MAVRVLTGIRGYRHDQIVADITAYAWPTPGRVTVAAPNDSYVHNLYTPRLLPLTLGQALPPSLKVVGTEAPDAATIAFDLVVTVGMDAAEAGDDTALIRVMPIVDWALAGEEAGDDAGEIPFTHDNRVWRGLAGGACGAWERATVRDHATAAAHGLTASLRLPAASGWSLASRQWRAQCAGHAQSVPLRSRASTGWALGSAASGQTCLPHESGIPVRAAASVRWQDGIPVLGRACDHWIVLYRDVRPALRDQWQRARQAPPVSRCSGWQRAIRTFLPYCWGWQEGLPVTGWGRDPYTPPELPVVPEPPCFTPPPGRDVPLDLWEPLARFDPRAVPLVMLCEAWGGKALVVIPIMRVYLTMDTASLCLLPLCTPIHVLGMTIATDADSWAWTLSAELPATELAKVRPVDGDPAEVRATINGVAWEFVVEEISRSREFGKATLSIRGRSRTAYLAAPYAQVQTWRPTVGALARQIAQDALPYSYGLDWTLTMDPYDEWLVPAGAWSMQGTPLDAVLDIASAVEAVVQSHRTDERLIVQSRYPVAPWGWAGATPDYAIPLDVIRQEGMEWMGRPRYNRVFVAGESGGVLAQVTRALSAGDLIAPTALHQALTHQYAAHERGLAILANTGRQALVSMETALIPSLGLDVILPGKLVQIGDTEEGNWRGLVRGVEIVAGRPAVTQKIEIERHYL